MHKTNTAGQFQEGLRHTTSTPFFIGPLRYCGRGGTQGPDLTLNLAQVFIYFVHQNEPICAGMGSFVPDNGTNQLLVKFYPILM